MADVTRTIQTLDTERQKIERLIAKFEQILQGLDRGDIPENQPYVSPRRGMTVADLQSPHKTLREALDADLAILRQQLKEVVQQGRFRHSTPTAPAPQGPKPAALPQRPGSLAAAHAEIKKGMAELAKISSMGDGGEAAKILGELQLQAEHAIQLGLGPLRANPSSANLTGMLKSLALSAALGNDSASAGTAWIEVAGATKKRVATAENRFRAAPTTKNLACVFSELGLNQAVGGDAQVARSGWVPAGGIAHTTATTGPPETLSGLSKKYYGSFGFWDVIFFANLGVIGNDPDKLIRGVTLTIP